MTARRRKTAPPPAANEIVKWCFACELTYVVNDETFAYDASQSSELGRFRQSRCKACDWDRGVIRRVRVPATPRPDLRKWLRERQIDLPGLDAPSERRKYDYSKLDARMKLLARRARRHP